MADKKKTEAMKEGFDRWTSLGMGMKFPPLTEEQKKNAEKINKELENEQFRKLLGGK